MEQKTYNYRLQGIEIAEKSLYHSVLADTDLFNFDVKTQGALDDNRKVIIIVIEIVIRKLNEPDALAKFVTAFGFELLNYDTVLNKDDKGTTIMPVELENLLKSISLSTMRGIIFSELRGTVLHRALMPIIPMDSLKPEEGNLIERLKENIKPKVTK